MIKRWFSSPLLSLALFVVWLLLNQSLDAGTLLLGAVFAIVVPRLTRSLRPAAVRMRKPALALRLAGRAIGDMLRSALAVGWRLMTRPSSELQPAFVFIPLDMRDPNALAALAMIFCLTPGTAWGELSFDRSSLLIHVFNLDDEEAFVALIKARYERPLMEIFES